MSKNPLIAEGGRGRTLSNVSKLLTDTSAGTTVPWVPEDERVIRTLYVTKNGVYRASDEGLYGYSKVTVNVAGGAQGLTVPTIDSEGNPTDYSVPTYGPLEVDTETEPTELPDFAGGYELPIVEYDGDFYAVDPDTGDYIPFDLDEYGDFGYDGFISGVDPDTGAPVMVTTDELGNLVEEELPAELVVWRKPDKVVYDDGETIRYGGITCRLKRANGSWYDEGNYSADKQHQAGKVPFSELVFPETNADISKASGDGGYYSDFDTSPFTQPIAVASVVSWMSWTGNNGFAEYTLVADEGTFILPLAYQGSTGELNIDLYIISKSQNLSATMTRTYVNTGETSTYVPTGWSSAGSRVSTCSADGLMTYTREMDRPFAINVGTYYSGTYTGPLNMCASAQEQISYWSGLSQNDSVASHVNATVLYGNYIGQNTEEIPVQWKRKDGVTLEASFNITVTNAGGGGGSFTPGGGGGQGGGGGGGAF